LGGGVDTEKEEKEKNETIYMADRDSGGRGGGSKLYVEGIEELVRLMVRLFAACIRLFQACIRSFRAHASVASGRMH